MHGEFDALAGDKSPSLQGTTNRGLWNVYHGWHRAGKFCVSKSLVMHAWHFRTRNCTFKMRQIFPKPRDNFGSLVANLRIVKLLKLRELILVRVFLEGYLRVIGRQVVSHGSK